MRNLTKTRLSALAALFIGSSALAGLPALAAPGDVKISGVQMAQADVERRGGGERGGQRGERGPRGGERGERGGGPQMERAPRGDVAPRMERGPRMERERTTTRRDIAPDRRFDERRVVRDRRFEDRRRFDDRRRYDDRRYRYRPGYRQGFVFLGGPRVIVRGYGPNWCRGLHRGYHWAPRIGWHAGTHRGLFRCY